MRDWESLEEYVKILLSYDHPVRTPGSGSTKGEEDVVGISTLSQCKFTTDTNTSILHKDLLRLISSANLIDKLPLFFTRSANITMLSVPITLDTDAIINNAIKTMVVNYGLQHLLPKVRFVKDNKSLQALYTERNRLVKINKDIQQQIATRLTQLDNAIDAKKDDILTYDLFEQESNDATKSREEKTSHQNDGEVPKGS